jgi:phenylpropionate dioxygenase-like ring-hydroxylating dioxygenase large terminal subunit
VSNICHPLSTIDAATGKHGAATSLPIHAAGDLLFVFLPTDITGESWPITRLPEDHYPYLQERIGRGTTYFSRDLPYSLDFLLENFMDPAHIPFAHHSLQGTRDDGSHIEMSVVANNFTHVECSFIDICRGKQRDGVLSFERPALYHFRTRANETAEYTPNLLVFATPIEAGKCRVMMPDFPIKFLPKWLGHIGSNRFLNTDTWLHNAERVARINADSINKQRGIVAVGAAKAGRKPTNGLNYILATQSDLGPTTFRKWWSKYGFADSPPNTFGAASASSLPSHALSRAEQIDPWHHHAKNCAKCRRGLRLMRALQKISTAGAAIGAILLRNRPPFAIALVIAGLYAHNFLRKFATTIEGNNHRSEIDGRSVATIK